MVRASGGDSETVMRAMVQAFDTGDTSSVESYVHPDYLDHQGLRGHRIRGAAGFATVVGAARTGFLRLNVTVEDLISGSDRAAARLRWTGTRESGDDVVRETLEIVRIVDGRAIEHWGGRS